MLKETLIRYCNHCNIPNTASSPEPPFPLNSLGARVTLRPTSRLTRHLGKRALPSLVDFLDFPEVLEQKKSPFPARKRKDASFPLSETTQKSDRK